MTGIRSHNITEICYITGILLAYWNTITIIPLVIFSEFHSITGIVMLPQLYYWHCFILHDWNSIVLPEYLYQMLLCYTARNIIHYKNSARLPEFHFITLPEFYYVTGILLHYQNSITLHYQKFFYWNAIPLHL